MTQQELADMCHRLDVQESYDVGFAHGIHIGAFLGTVLALGIYFLVKL